MSRHAWTLPFGAELLAPDLARFRLWAPARTAVDLVVDDHAPEPMQAVGGGWFELRAPCSAGARYAFQLDDGLRIPDPASRAQAGDVHGPSVVVDPHAYEWQATAWRGRPWRETVLYELHVGLCGGFEGVTRLLPALAELGVTAIELMPIHDFPGARNWGYDGVLPFAPDRSYGTPEQLKALIDAAHGLELMVFLDVVYNHFGPDGNFLARYAPEFFRDDRPTPWGAAIDFRRPEVRGFFVGNARYWLMEYRFDGLRLDAVHAIDDPTFLDDLALAVRAVVEPDRHVHLVLENERNLASHLERHDGRTALFDAQWNDDFHNVVHVLLTGEDQGYYRDYVQAPAAKLARSLREGFVYQGEPSPSQDGRPRGTASAHLPPTAFVQFLQNHDQVGNRALGERLTRLADPDALRAATVLLLLSPGIPLLFMGQERGCEAPFLYFTDHHPELAAAVRDGRVREFARFPAFADAERGARIPDPNAAATYHASAPALHAAPRGRHADWSALHRRLLRLRRTWLVPSLGSVTGLGAEVLGDAAVVARWQLDGRKEWTVMVNLGAEPVAIPRPGGRLVCESRAHAGDAIAGGWLPGRRAAVYLGDAP